MTGTEDHSVSASLPVGEFSRRFLQLAAGYWTNGEQKWTARLLGGGLVALTVAQVFVPILTNLWSKQLFDALEAKSLDLFLLMIAASVGIIILNVSITVAHLYVKRRIQLGWRQWISVKVIGEWLTRGHHHQITYLPGDHDNPDGRIAEDIRIITEYAADLGMSLLYCVLLLISFISILWNLSGAPEVTVAGLTFAVPGYLIYVAILYAGAGTLIAMLIAQPMVNAANGRQSREADFRFGLARVRENAQEIALLHGESDERRRLFHLFRGVKTGWNRQTRAIGYWISFTSAYSVLSMAFPILVVAPRYITGSITLGMLMQTTQAFQQTAAALSWPVDSLARVAEWKASVERILRLVDAIQRSKRDLGASEDTRIVVDHGAGEARLTFRGVSVAEPDGTPVIAPFDLDISPGDRVLFSGDAAAAIRLFRAVARVWPWGGGRITLPDAKHVFFMPERPYLPHGSLRAILAYPQEPDAVSDEEAWDALRRVGLDDRVESLDDPQPWEETLAVAEQQRLGFARLLVRKPDWIFIQNATDNLNREGVAAMLAVLDAAFPKATVMTIGSHSILDDHHDRHVLLERTNGAVHLRQTRRALASKEPA